MQRFWSEAGKICSVISILGEKSKNVYFKLGDIQFLIWLQQS